MSDERQEGASVRENAAERDVPSSSFGSFPGGTILRATSPEMLAPFAKELGAAARDFCRRAQSLRSPATDDGYEADDVQRMLLEATTAPDQVVWVVVDERYRLLGFLAATLVTTLARARLEAQVVAYYLFPRRMNLAIGGVLLQMLERWARASGAQRLVFFTHRERPRAWRRLGFEPVSTVYAKALDAPED